MKLCLLAVAGLAVGFAAPTVAQEKAGTCSGPRDACEQVVALIKTYDEAFNRKDVAAIGAVFTADAVEATEGPMLAGREALEKHYSEVFKAGLSNVVVNVDQMHAADDTTWAVGDWSLIGPGPNSTTQPYHGNWGAVWVKKGGAWRLRMLTNNTIEAPPQ
jgi:uncharacterized protein (TIGR02246 family)